MKKLLSNWGLVVLLCLTLGLAPYQPEPHIWGKLKWVWGGGTGMTWMDIFDLILHGFPFLLLIALMVRRVRTISQGFPP